MKINKEQIINEFDLIPFGGKGWLRSDALNCPHCNRSDKFGILFTSKGGVTHCFRECANNLSLAGYLKEIGRKDLILYETEVSLNTKLKSLKKEVEIIPELPEVSLPKGYRRIYFDSYLRGRNFKSHQYEQFEVGVTDHFLERRLHNYLIFVIKQKGKVVGWLARSKFSKKFHKENEKAHKLGLEPLKLRYINSTGTEFERILGGFDEITDETHTVLTVEGLFDYTNTSNLLRTEESDEVKVIFTFGNKFSEDQIKLLRETKVKTVILMYDPETVSQSKKYALELSKYFEVFVCYIKDKTIDPGNISAKYLDEVLDNMKNSFDFYTSKI